MSEINLFSELSAVTLEYKYLNFKNLLKKKGLLDVRRTSVLRLDIDSFSVSRVIKPVLIPDAYKIMIKLDLLQFCLRKVKKDMHLICFSINLEC